MNLPTKEQIKEGYYCQKYGHCIKMPDSGADEDGNIPDGTPCQCGETKNVNKYTLEEAKKKLEKK